MQVVQALQVEDEVAQCVQIDELDRVHFFLEFLFSAVLGHHSVGFHKVEVHIEPNMVLDFLGVLDLYGLQGFKRVLPLNVFESYVVAILVEFSFDVNEELGCEHDEARLVSEVASLDDKGVILVAILSLHV